MNEREANHDAMLRARLVRAKERFRRGICLKPGCDARLGMSGYRYCPGCRRDLAETPGGLRVYLDDARETPEGWFRTWNVAETVAVLQTKAVEELSLDHDLGVSPLSPDDQEETGYEVVAWLEKQFMESGRLWIDPRKVSIHSANPVGAERMKQCLERIKLAFREEWRRARGDA